MNGQNNQEAQKQRDTGTWSDKPDSDGIEGPQRRGESSDGRIRFIDLFAGVGGFRLGLENASSERPRDRGGTQNIQDGGEQPERQGDDKHFRCVFTNDFDRHATSVYNHNFKESREATDIRKIRAESIPKHDLLCGGFPCQSFSIAGKRKGFEDTRGTLFYEICRVAEFHRPSILFLENVKGLLNHSGGRTFRTILRSLDELGYDAEWEVLNSKNFGVPQNRERVFIVGHLRGEPWREVFPLGEVGEEASELQGQQLSTNTIKTPTGGFQPQSFIVESEQHAQEEGVQVMPVLTPDRPEILAWSKSTREEGRVEERIKVGEANTLSTGEGGGNASTQNYVIQSHSPRIRRLTPTECERLQGFPDGWTKLGIVNGKTVEISDTQRYKMMGNAVTVNVIQAIGERILEAMR